jgi:hypothetical protein
MLLVFLLRLLVGFLLLFLLPLATHAAYYATRDDLATNWATADWSSAKLLPDPARSPDALVRIYAARTGRWKGIVAHHSWVVVKEKGASRYVRFDKVGWGSPVRTNAWPADARWFGNEPQLVVAIDGPEAEALIPKIRAAVADYPYAHWGDYRVWPGPNSNTFIAHVMSEVPELHAALPPTALGKDYHPVQNVFSLTPSRTGFQIQLGGYAGLSIGWVEGIEVNLLGLVTGLDLRRPALKVPGWGRIGVPATA